MPRKLFYRFFVIALIPCLTANVAFGDIRLMAMDQTPSAQSKHRPAWPLMTQALSVAALAALHPLTGRRDLWVLNVLHKTMKPLRFVDAFELTSEELREAVNSLDRWKDDGRYKEIRNEFRSHLVALYLEKTSRADPVPRVQEQSKTRFAISDDGIEGFASYWTTPRTISLIQVRPENRSHPTSSNKTREIPQKYQYLGTELLAAAFEDILAHEGNSPIKINSASLILRTIIRKNVSDPDGTKLAMLDSTDPLVPAYLAKEFVASVAAKRADRLKAGGHPHLTRQVDALIEWIRGLDHISEENFVDIVSKARAMIQSPDPLMQLGADFLLGVMIVRHVRQYGMHGLNSDGVPEDNVVLSTIYPRYYGRLVAVESALQDEWESILLNNHFRTAAILWWGFAEMFDLRVFDPSIFLKQDDEEGSKREFQNASPQTAWNDFVSALPEHRFDLHDRLVTLDSRLGELLDFSEPGRESVSSIGFFARQLRDKRSLFNSIPEMLLLIACGFMNSTSRAQTTSRTREYSSRYGTPLQMISRFLNQAA